MDKYLWHLPYGCIPTAPYVVCSSNNRGDEKGGVKRVSCGRCGTVLCIKCQKLCGSAADLPGLCNGWAQSVKPLLLSLIHVTQDNMHRSWGATVGDTEKEADPVGGWGGTEEGGMEGRVGDLSSGVVRQKMFLQPKSQTDTKTLFTELCQESCTSTLYRLITPLKPTHATEKHDIMWMTWNLFFTLFCIVLISHNRSNVLWQIVEALSLCNCIFYQCSDAFVTGCLMPTVFCRQDCLFFRHFGWDNTY